MSMPVSVSQSFVDVVCAWVYWDGAGVVAVWLLLVACCGSVVLSHVVVVVFVGFSFAVCHL